MGKYILKYVDDVEDQLAATITYEFKTDLADNVLADDITWHLANFMRAVGFGWIENLEIVKQKCGEDGIDEFSDESEESSNDVHIIFGSDVNPNNVSVSRDKDKL
jgi:hypothetical protein